MFQGCTPAELPINLNVQDSPSGHSSLLQSKSLSLQLAPLKGPIPQLSSHSK